MKPEFTHDDKLLLNEYWYSYHHNLIPLGHVLGLKIMQEKFFNNKSKDSYEGIGYFTFINNCSE